MRSFSKINHIWINVFCKLVEVPLNVFREQETYWIGLSMEISRLEKGKKTKKLIKEKKIFGRRIKEKKKKLKNEIHSFMFNSYFIDENLIAKVNSTIYLDKKIKDTLKKDYVVSYSTFKRYKNIYEKCYGEFLLDNWYDEELAWGIEKLFELYRALSRKIKISIHICFNSLDDRRKYARFLQRKYPSEYRLPRREKPPKRNNNGINASLDILRKAFKEDYEKNIGKINF